MGHGGTLVLGNGDAVGAMENVFRNCRLCENTSTPWVGAGWVRAGAPQVGGWKCGNWLPTMESGPPEADIGNCEWASVGASVGALLGHGDVDVPGDVVVVGEGRGRPPIPRRGVGPSAEVCVMWLGRETRSELNGVALAVGLPHALQNLALSSRLCLQCSHVTKTAHVSVPKAS